MRVVTLLPAATEIVAAVGGIDQLVGVSHECDFPEAVRALPRVTTTPLDPAAPGFAIDAEVRRLRAAGRPVIALDADELRRLGPDLVVTQGLCDVCAVADGEVRHLARVLDPPPCVLSLSATTLGGIFEDVRTVGRALDRVRRAEALVADLRNRLDRLRASRRDRRRRVVAIEWLEPLYLAGHWVPELISAAGGSDIGAEAGAHSARRAWDEIDALGPELLAVMLCGFDVGRARAELAAVQDPVARRVLARYPVWVLDGNAYTSRAGPRVVDGAERLQAMLADREMAGLARWHSPWTAG